MPDLKIEIDVRSVKKSEKDLSNYLKNINNSIMLVDSSIKKLEESFGKTSTSIVKDTKKVSSTTQKELKKTATAWNGFLKTVKAAAVGYATVLATMEIQQFVTDTFQAGIAVDSLRRSFEAITGSTNAAAMELQFIDNISVKLGLDLVTLEKSYKDILAASKGTSLEGKNVRDVFTAISKASAVLGMSADDTTGALRALSQMISKGNVQAEELRGQLGERLPGAFQMAAEAMGVSTMKLNDMLENGEVLAEDMLPKLAKVLEQRFGKAAETAGDRAQAAFIKLGNAVQKFQRNIMEAGLMDFLAQLAETSTNVINALNEIGEPTGLEARLQEVQRQIELLDNTEERFLEARIRREGRSRQALINTFGGGRTPGVVQAMQQRDLGALPSTPQDIVQTKKLEAAIIASDLALVSRSQAQREFNELLKEESKVQTEVEKKLSQLQKENREKYAIDIANARLIKDLNLDRLESLEKETDKVNKEIAKRNKKFHDDEMKRIMEQAKSVKDLNLARLEGLKGLEVSPLPVIGAFDQYVESINQALDATELLESYTVQAFKGMEDALVGFIMGAEQSWRDYANVALAEITRIFVRQSLIQPLASGFQSADILGGIGNLFSGFFNATGNVVTGNSIHAASNSIIDSPTYFPNISRMDKYATGGIAGEAGPELIAPVKRMPSGNMGIETSGLMPEINFIVQVENNVSDFVQVSTTEMSKTNDGSYVVGVMVDALQRNPVVQGLVQKVTRG